jgi:hypothetical protein
MRIKIKTNVQFHGMNKTMKRHTNLGSEILYAAVGWRGNLGFHEMFNELSPRGIH